MVVIMYICCRHCKHNGNFVHERGHSCRLHNCFINYNDKESVELMFNCKDCQLDISDVFSIARYCKSISVEYIFDEYFEVMNNMGVVIKDSKEWNNGFYKDMLKAYKVKEVTNDHVIGYKVLFDGFPVYSCERMEEINFILKGLGLQ